MERKDPQLILDQMNTLDELYSVEIPQIIMNSTNDIDKSILKGIRTVYAIGDGDSLYAASAVEYLFRDITSVSYFAVPAFEFLSYVLPFLVKDKPSTIMVIGISASGSSSFVIKAIEEIKSTYPDIVTVSVSGNENGTLNKVAQYKESVQIKELGRTPGIRTYVASIAGLLSLAFSLQEASLEKQSIYSRNSISSYSKKVATGIKHTIKTVHEAMSNLLPQYSGYYLACLGSGPSFSTAAFSAAKIVESSGIFAYGQDIEEYNHVEGFAYPLNSLIIVFAFPGSSFKRAATLIDSASNLGHKIIVVTTPEAAPSFSNFPVITLHEITNDVYDDLLTPLTAYIPMTLFGYYLAKQEKRMMFLTT